MSTGLNIMAGWLAGVLYVDSISYSMREGAISISKLVVLDTGCFGDPKELRSTTNCLLIPKQPTPLQMKFEDNRQNIILHYLQT